jgi:nucleoside-triphosphatase THEP1
VRGEASAREDTTRHAVLLDSLDTVALPALAVEPGALYLVDEIGKMESLSRAFTGAVAALLDSGLPVVATVAQRGSGFIAEVKRHPRAELWEVTGANRDGMPPRVVEWVRG